MSFAKIAIAAISSAVFTLALPAVNSAIAADRVHEGQKAPSFTLTDEKGKPTQLGDFAGKQLIVFFYDADFVPLPPKQSGQQKKDVKKYNLENVDVLCIGPDPVSSHKAMNTRLPLKYHLLTDKDDTVRTSYGLPPAVKGLHNNYALVVDKDGTIKKLVDGTATADKEESMANAMRYLGDFSVSAF